MALALAVNPSVHVPQDELDRMWDCILLYDEHTWRVQQHQRSKVRLCHPAVRGQGRVRRGGRRSRPPAARPRHASTVLGVSPEAGFAVRIQPVRPDAQRRGQRGHTPRLVVLGDAGVVPQQVVREDATDAVGVAFLASDVAPAGYKLYRVGKAEQAAVLPKRFDGKVLENDFYRVEFSPVGGVASFRDKKLGKELVDQSSAYKLGQIIYAAGGGNPDGSTPEEAPDSVPREVQHHYGGARRGGRGRAAVLERQVDRRAPADSQRRARGDPLRARAAPGLRLPAGQGDGVDQGGRVLRVPVRGAHPRFCYEIGGGCVRPNEDHFPGACCDWFAVQRWVTVQTDDAAVTWSAVDTPLISLCGMNAGKWLEELPITNGTIFAYALNNYWMTNYKAGQDGPFTFRYSMTSGKTVDPAAAAMFGESVQSPLRVIHADPHPDAAASPVANSFCEVRPSNVEMTALKPADDGHGIIVRIRETAGATPTPSWCSGSRT